MFSILLIRLLSSIFTQSAISNAVGPRASVLGYPVFRVVGSLVGSTVGRAIGASLASTLVASIAYVGQ